MVRPKLPEICWPSSWATSQRMVQGSSVSPSPVGWFTRGRSVMTERARTATWEPEAPGPGTKHRRLEVFNSKNGSTNARQWQRLKPRPSGSSAATSMNGSRPILHPAHRIRAHRQSDAGGVEIIGYDTASGQYTGKVSDHSTSRPTTAASGGWL